MHEDAFQGNPFDVRQEKLHNLINKHEKLLDELISIEEELLSLLIKGRLSGWERDLN